MENISGEGEIDYDKLEKCCDNWDCESWFNGL